MNKEKPAHKNSIEIEGREFEVDDNRYVKFASVAQSLLEQQAQYASRKVDSALPGYPSLGDGLRFDGDPGMYHDLRIHKDDIVEFIERYRKYEARSD